MLNVYRLLHPLVNGDYWEANYKGERTNLQNLERIRYIIHLLDNPGVEIASHDLVSLVKGVEAEQDEVYGELSQEQLEAEGFSLVDLEIEGLSQREKDGMDNQIHDEWDRLERAKESGDPSRIDEANRKWKILKRHLLNEYGIYMNFSSKGVRFTNKPKFLSFAFSDK